MHLIQRKPTARRNKKPLELQLVQYDYAERIVFEGEDGIFYILYPESEDEIKHLMSQIHRLYQDFLSMQDLRATQKAHHAKTTR